MTASALAEMDTILKLFEDGAVHSRGVAMFLVSLLASSSEQIYSPLLFQDLIRNLQRKAHESVSQTQSHSTTNITPSELDRLSGQTHLLADTGARDSGDNGPSDSITHTDSLEAQGHCVVNTQPDVFLDVHGDSMHPTIAQDMTRFDMGTAGFNNPFFDFSTPSSVSQLPVPDLRGPDINFYLAPTYPMYPSQPPSQSLAGFEQHQPAPVLDATWQSFVEQLGF
jgi:hypothetical protein